MDHENKGALHTKLFRHLSFGLRHSFVIRHSSFVIYLPSFVIFFLLSTLSRAQTPLPSPPDIKDIAPPVDVLPWPMWLVVLVAGAALAIVCLLVWLAVHWWRNRPVPPPPTPREIALAALQKARAQTGSLDPYAFSILVSDILRQYVSAQFQLRATRQTSPEFLAAISDFQKFTDPEKAQLAVFLEKCDLIKFARVTATGEESTALLDQAVRFVEGGEANDE